MNETIKDYLQYFTNLCIAIKKLEEEDSIKNYNKLLDDKVKSEEMIKNYVRETGEDVNNGIVETKTVERWNKSYDYDVIAQDEATFKAIQVAGGIKKEIVRAVAEKCAKDGTASLETLQKAYIEEKGSSAISVKINL
jgi:hypothetical protein